MSKFIYTNAIRKLRKLNSRVKIVPGGTGGGKTWGILPVLIDRAARTPNTEISIVSESIPHLRRGAMKDFQKIMQITNRWNPESFSSTHLKYTFKNGSYIEFFGADQPDKLRGARRNILYINECNNVTFDVFQELSIRTSQEIWLDFNPTNRFWVHDELYDDVDSEVCVLTYVDNEALPDSIRQQIEKAKEKAKTSAYWENWWNVYGLGKLGRLQGTIFNNWSVIDKIPDEARLIGIGMDFGYTNDPTAIIEVYKWNDKRILNELCYRTGMLNKDIANQLPKDIMVYADSAEPKSIEEIRRSGVNIKGATKGRDSIVHGIQLMQSEDYLVTKKSTNLIEELRVYAWDKDRQGNTLNKPIDKHNHAIDAVRYHEAMDIRTNAFFTF